MMNKTLGWLLDLNKKILFPLFIIIFLIILLLRVTHVKLTSNVLNLEYKLLIVLISGIILLLDQYVFQKKKFTPKSK